MKTFVLCVCVCASICFSGKLSSDTGLSERLFLFSFGVVGVEMCCLDVLHALYVCMSCVVCTNCVVSCFFSLDFSFSTYCLSCFLGECSLSSWNLCEIPLQFMACIILLFVYLLSPWCCSSS